MPKLRVVSGGKAGEGRKSPPVAKRTGAAKPAEKSAELKGEKKAAKGGAQKGAQKGEKKGEVSVLGERLSNPDRVYYPDAGITKLDLARYYEAVGESMLPHVRGRPLSLVRCPEGIAGDCFYAKHVALHVSRSLTQIPIRESKKTAQYLVVDSVPGLVALAQMGMLEIHTWNSTREHLENPDRFVLDLDPGPEVPWSETVEAAQLCRSTLKEVGLEGFLKTTGGKGLHVVVPTAPELDWEASLALSRAIAELIVKQRPRRYTTDMPKAGRERKILIDYFRNSRGATSVAAFSTRARPGATVSVPIAWDELDARLRPGYVHAGERAETAGESSSEVSGEPLATLLFHQAADSERSGSLAYEGFRMNSNDAEANTLNLRWRLQQRGSNSPLRKLHRLMISCIVGGIL